MIFVQLDMCLPCAFYQGHRVIPLPEWEGHTLGGKVDIFTDVVFFPVTPDISLSILLLMTVA